MIVTKLKWIGLIVLVSGLALTSAGVMARQNTRKSELPSQREAAENGSEEATGTTRERETGSEKIYRVLVSGKKTKVRIAEDSPSESKDPYQELLRAARAAYQATLESFMGGQASPISGLSSFATLDGRCKRRKRSQRLTRTRRSPHIVTESGISCAPTPSGKTITGGGQSAANVAEGRAFLAEAEVWLAQAKTANGKRRTTRVAGLAKRPPIETHSRQARSASHHELRRGDVT